MTRRTDSLVRVLRCGGMLVAGKDGYMVYRSRDARRARAGVLSIDEFETLHAAGELSALPDNAERWVWRNCDEEAAITPVPIPDAMSFAGARAKPDRRSIFEIVLTHIADPHQREWLARAAARFMRDYEQQSATQSVTMRWEFDRGRVNGRRHGALGMSEMSLSAQKALGQIRETLGTEDFELIERVLIGRHSKRRLCYDFALKADALIARLAKLFEQVARLYDMRIAAPT